MNLKTELRCILLEKFKEEICKEKKLTDEQVESICELLNKESISAEEIIEALSFR